MSKVDSFGSKGVLNVAGTEYEIFRLSSVEGSNDLPYSLKILLENLLRTEDGANITADHVRALANWDPNAQPDTEIQFTPARVIMQDFTGVPCVVDLATMNAMSNSNTSAMASGTSSCVGARPRSTTSRSSRRAPASCTRSTWSTWPAP